MLFSQVFPIFFCHKWQKHVREIGCGIWFVYEISEKYRGGKAIYLIAVGVVGKLKLQEEIFSYHGKSGIVFFYY